MFLADSEGLIPPDSNNDSDVKRLIQEKLGCGIDQVDDIINQSMPIESLDVIYEMFLNYIEKDGMQDNDFENTTENEMHQDVLQNTNTDVFYCNYDVYEEIEQGVLREILEYVLESLTYREQEVLKARYGLEDGIEKTLEELGQTMNVTRERIRQIEAKAKRKLSRRKILADFL